MNKDNITFKLTRSILVVFTLATMLAVALGSIEILTTRFTNFAATIESLYGIVITAGIVTVIAKLWMLPSINEGFSLKEAKTCKSIANIFLFEFACELIHGVLSNKGERIFEIFNVKVSILMIVFLLCAFAFMSVGKLIINYVELQEDNKLTV
ncbi:MAG: hypothetical protein HXM67_03405 [Mogibacterium diversum]|uniref:hypothetical protein n=1 Tax=Mogibacterium diversum TaxID=114527 RepID=UPI001CAE8B22|nr:hypothetical protein [Mogibacterium diversum]MBF1338333.1 hypothetical protein [Mogibacterium diversum]MBF1341093.1 hypothetical protein [Mogibacterium diversum]